MKEIKDLRRELIWEALDGAVIQTEGAQRFLVRGEDKCAADAMRRAYKFFRQAAATMGELIAEPPSKEKREIAA